MSDEFEDMAADCAAEARTYLASVSVVASGAEPDTAIPVLLLAVSQVLAMGARLGALTDVVPDDRFEVDTGPDTDVDPVHSALAELLDGLDEYADLVDPVTSVEVTKGTISGDIAVVAAALTHGLGHYDAGRVSEAMWWWQFSYLSTWGERAASAVRVLQTVLGHLRLDADDELVLEAQFDALHP
jgi:hypothetical protein